MTTQNAHSKNTAAANPALEFAGFNDWFEIFLGGEQTDSLGRTKTFTEAELDSVVANFEQGQAPLVIGHPEQTAPAWGWVSALKREGQTLFAKASDVVAEFEQAVKQKMYPKRSVSLEPDGKGGFALRHIGFLGAKPPAVKGLKDLNFNAQDTAITFEFSQANDMAYGLTSLARLLRGVREHIVAKEGIDTADSVLPSWEIDSVTRIAQEIEANHTPEQQFSQGHESALSASAASALSAMSTEHLPLAPNNSKPETPMSEKTYSQEEMDAAIKKADAAQKALDAQKAEFAQQQKVAECQTLVQQAVKAGHVTPALSEGLAEFMAALPDGQEQAFEFAQGDATASQTPLAFFKGLLAQAKPVMNFGQHEGEEPAQQTPHDFAAPDGLGVDGERAQLHNKAMDYAEKHNCDYATAVAAVNK